MRTRLEEVEDMLFKVDEELYEELHTNQYGGVCSSSIEELIEMKVSLEIEKDRLTRRF